MAHKIEADVILIAVYLATDKTSQAPAVSFLRPQDRWTEMTVWSRDLLGAAELKLRLEPAEVVALIVTGIPVSKAIRKVLDAYVREEKV